MLKNKGNVNGVVVLLVRTLMISVPGLAKPPMDPTACPHLPVSMTLKIPASISGDDEMDDDDEGGKEEKADAEPNAQALCKENLLRGQGERCTAGGRTEERAGIMRWRRLETGQGMVRT